MSQKKRMAKCLADSGPRLPPLGLNTIQRNVNIVFDCVESATFLELGVMMCFSLGFSSLHIEATSIPEREAFQTCGSFLDTPEL